MYVSFPPHVRLKILNSILMGYTLQLNLLRRVKTINLLVAGPISFLCYENSVGEYPGNT